MDELQKLYDLLVREGKYTKSFDEFKTKWSGEEGYQDKVFDVVSRDGFYTKDKESFIAKYGAPELKKKEEAFGPLPAEGVPSFTEFPSAVGPSVSPEPIKPKPVIKDETPKEKPYFTGKFGAALEVMDLVSPFGIGDFIDDMGRAIDAGQKQGAVVTPANQLLVSGKYASPETIQKFVTASKAMQNAGPSDEMMNYQKIYEEEGKGIFGVLKGLAKNPGAIPELIMSSYNAMINPTSLASAGTVVGGAAAGGALFGGAGAAPAAIASAPFAMAAAGTTLETGLTFSELLQEKLEQKGLDFTEENVKKILEDDNALSDIRVKSVARGATIGAIDAMTGRLAGKVGAKLLGNTVASKVKAGLAAGGIESVGGSVGETAGRVVAGQPLDVSEIALEGISESPSAAIDIVSEVMRKPVYKVNGENRTEADIEEILRVGTPDDISRMNIEIKNDNKGYKEKIQDIVVTNQIRKEVSEANPDIDEDSLNELVNLEKELKKFENNKTQSGKDKAASIRSQIKTIQENAIQKQTAGEVPVQSGAGVSETLAEGKPQAEPKVTPTEGVQEEVVQEEVIAPEERTTWSKVGYDLITPQGKQFKVGDIIDGSQLSELSGDLVDNEPNKKFILTQSPLSKFDVDRNKILSEEKGDEKEENDRIDSIKNNFNNTPPIPPNGDGRHRIAAAKELGLKTILQWKEVSSKTQPEVAPVVEQTESEQEREMYRLDEELTRAKRNIVYADDTEVAIEEYNIAKKAKEDFSAQIKEKKNKVRAKNNIQSLIEDETTAAKRERYEYKELYEQDPRLAALQNAKDLLEFSKSEESQKARIEMGDTIEEAQKSKEQILKTLQQDIADLEADLQANPVVSSKTQSELTEQEQGIATQLDDLVNNFNTAFSQPDARTTSEKRTATTKANKAIKKLNEFFGFTFGSRANEEQASKQDALSYIKDILNPNSPSVQFANVTELMNAYKSDKQNNVESPLVKSVDAIFGVAPTVSSKTQPEAAPVVEEEQYIPITEDSVSHDKFTKDNASDYETDFKTGDNGREYEYISRISVPLNDEDGNSIGNLVKIIDEDGTISWNAEDEDGNEVGKQDFDSKAEAQKALVDKANKIRKKEFDREAKKKAKAAEKEAAKKPKPAPVQQVEAEPTMEEIASIDAMLDLDVENEDNMLKILNALDNADRAITNRLRGGANDALLAIPLSTIQVVIKATRALVKGGMLLRDAIKKVAADNNLSEKKVIDILNTKSLDITNKEKSEMPMSADNVLYDNSKLLPKPQKKIKNSAVAKLIQSVASQFWGGSIVTSSSITPEQEDVITKNGIREAIEAFESSGKNAADWYSKAIETAMAVASVIHPELNSKEAASKIEVFAKEKDPVKAAQMALRMALAITSQNLNVDANTIYAEEQFEYFKKNGKFDPSREYGAKAPAISSNLKLANLLIEAIGINEAENFISKEFTVKELEDAFKKATNKQLVISGLRNDVVNGAAIFGPKIGQGFLQNLMGKFDPVTIDLWMRRTWGRWTGDVVGTGITEERMARLFLSVKEAIKNKELKIELPKEFFEYKPVQEKNKSGKFFWTMNQKFSDRVENDLSFVESINKIAKEISLKANTLYKAIHDMPMTKELYNKFISGELSYVQVANKLIAIRESMGDKYSQYAAKERLNNRKPIKKQDWIDSEDKKLNRIYTPSNEEISQRKPKWGNEAKNIVDDLNPIDVPTNLDRRVITRVVNNIRKAMNEQGYNVTNADVQALLWYPEKDIWAKLRGEEESNLKLSYDDQFIKLAEKRGLGKQAEQVADKIRSRGTESNITTLERGTDENIPSRVDEGRLESIEQVLDLDVKDKDNLNTVLSVLEKLDTAITKRLRGGANEALLAIPLSTVQVVVKGLKVLVQGGMKLRDAIRKVAADNNLSQDSVKDIMNISPIQDAFNELMGKVDTLINRQTARGVDSKRMTSNVDTFVRNSDVYQEANDAQKKIMEREARTKLDVKPRRAPSIGRILGALKDITSASRQDKLKIISNIRALSKDAAKDLAKEIRELATSGKITVKQAANIVARFGKVNMLSEISVSKFVDYMTKVFADAEYASKLSNANNLRKDIKKLSKNKDKNADLRDLGQKFSEIDPSMVEDIDAYNDMASKIKESIKGSTIRGQKVSIADMINIDDATEYINKTLDAQDKLMRQEMASEIQELMGIDVSEFSYDDMIALLNSKTPITKYNEGIIRDTINKAFGVFSSIIKETISTGKDPFTGEDVEFTKTQKDLVKRFMDMDLNVLKPKEAIQAVDALANFLQNKSTAKMETVVSQYTGIKNAKELSDKGVKSSRLQKYWSPWLGKFLGEQATNLNILFERMFKGFERGGMVMDKMGLTKLFNGKSSAERESNNIVEKYVKDFYKREANGETFNSDYNNVERGMAAFMMRSVIGTEAEMQNEFNRRRGLIEESISVLSQGNKKEKAKAELYQRAYDKIIKDSQNIKDISTKVDPTNLEAIEFWKEQWANKYEQLSDVSKNVYNKILDKDLNYVPDKFFKLSSDTGTVELDNEESAFHSNNGTLYQRETGVLMSAVRPETLPINPESGDVNRYIDLSFDNNNANSMYDALVDINTAAPIRQIQAFLNSSSFKSIVPESDDATILKDRIQLYVRNIRDKNPFSTDEMAKAVKALNKIAAIGVGQALGGITQPIKQVIPVAMNTVINAGGLDIGATFNKDKNDFITNSGYAIANRGVESQAQIESINKLIDKASNTSGEKAMKFIEEANKKWLELFLVKPDVYIARASWLTYYEQNLKKQGIDTKNIDYKTHELNEDAANYAQRMVDRQQNVSDIDLAGKLFSGKEPSKQLLVKTLMPFASFRMNQAARLGADLATFMNKTSSSEDKKIAARSVLGYGVEMVTFRLISIATSILLGTLAKKLMDRDEDDEDRKKRIDNIIKGARTGTFTDIFSPLPIADKLIQEGGSAILNKVEEGIGMPVSIFEPKKEEFFKSAGLFGISVERAGDLWELSKLATTGEYTDDFGRKKKISEKDMDGLKMLIAPAIMTNIGLAPSAPEVNTVIRNAIKDSKKKPSATAEEREAKMEREETREENLEQKLDALEEVRKKTRNQNVIDAIDEKIDELEATDEEKEIIKEENKEERELKKELLTDPVTGIEYDNESKLKRYNKRLWNKNFGPQSEWFKEHKYEKQAEQLMNKEIRKQEDKEYKYVSPTKRRNSDGSLKRTYGKKTKSYYKRG